MKVLKYSLIAFTIILISCNQQSKFDKTKWATGGNMEFPYRTSMLKDLTMNYKLVGLKYSELIVLLGQPQYHDGTLSIGYEIDTHYDVIDPVYNKKLVFTFNKDSVITSYKVNEWKKGY
ncbi:MAG: hypothetical protein ACM3VS_03165 [Candidatus Dadabacteria bacterium]